MLQPGEKVLGKVKRIVAVLQGVNPFDLNPKEPCTAAGVLPIATAIVTTHKLLLSIHEVLFHRPMN